MKIALNVLQQGPLSDGPEWWTLADRAGVDVIGLPDSPALVRELYVAAALCAEHTSRARIMTSVTNPLSRDPVRDRLVPADARGDRTRPNRLRDRHRRQRPVGCRSPPGHRVAVAGLHRGGQGRCWRGEEAHYQGRKFRMLWSDLPVGADIPVIVPVSGPKVLRMACEVSDGMLLSMGFGPHNVDHVRKSGRRRDARPRAAIRASSSCGGTPRSSSATAPTEAL